MRVCDVSVGLIAYAVSNEHVHAHLLNEHGRERSFTLARNSEVIPDLETLMDALRQPLNWLPSQRKEVIRAFMEDWGVGLLPPVDCLEEFDVLLILPHHFLHGVPLHLVQLGQQPLALSHGIAYCSSATLLQRCFGRNRNRINPPDSWEFPLGDDGTIPSGPEIRSCKSCAADVLTNKEVSYRLLATSFASQFPEHCLVKSRYEVKSALRCDLEPGQGESLQVAPDVLCLVCHGHLDRQYGERSGLLLHGEPGLISMTNILVHGDTVLRISDLPFTEIPMRLDLVRPTDHGRVFHPELLSRAELAVQSQTTAQLVALFGCSTASGFLASNDDYDSLAYQWLKIGAVSVLANLWESDINVLEAWGRCLALGLVRDRQPKALAVREATRALLREHPEWLGQPELWGCMTLYGDWM